MYLIIIRVLISIVLFSIIAGYSKITIPKQQWNFSMQTDQLQLFKRWIALSTG